VLSPRLARSDRRSAEGAFVDPEKANGVSKTVIRFVLSACAIAALSAQSPAPSPSPDKPLRHLEYAYSVSVQGIDASEFNGLNGGVETSSGAGGAVTSDGADGTMMVDIMGVNPNGTLRVRISETVKDQPRPRQAFTCDVSGNTTVLCPSVPAPSAAQWVLLSYLGREFVDGAPWTADGHWSRNESSDEFALQEDFTLVDAGKDNKAVVQETKKMDLHNGGFSTATSTITITYDRKLEVPDVIRDEVVTSGGNNTGQAHYTFTLTKDSFGPAAK
jgi:hypothetical protein